MDALTKQCLGLNYEDRKTLIDNLQRSLETDVNPESKGKAAHYLDVMSDIVGRPIPLRIRESVFVWCRDMVIYQLLSEGYNTIQVGKMMSKNHATVIHARDTWQDALNFPFAFRAEMKIWKEFQKRIEDETDREAD